MDGDVLSFTIAEAIEDLESELDDLASQAQEAESRGESAEEIDRRGMQLDQQLAALENTRAEHGPSAEYVIRELSPGERAEFGDLLAAAQRQHQEQIGTESDTPNLRDLFWTAAGLEAAPWLPSDAGEIMERVPVLRSGPGWRWHEIQYLKRRVTEANTVGNGERRSYRERRQESQTPRNEPS